MHGSVVKTKLDAFGLRTILVIFDKNCHEVVNCWREFGATLHGSVSYPVLSNVGFCCTQLTAIARGLCSCIEHIDCYYNLHRS